MNELTTSQVRRLAQQEITTDRLKHGAGCGYLVLWVIVLALLFEHLA